LYKLWYEELGFIENPFTIRPNDDLSLHVGQDEVIKELIKLIPKKSIIHLSGIYGSGKTTILQGIIRKFAGKKRVIYYNCNENMDRINLKSLISGAGTKFQRLFGRTSRNLLLLIDEAQHVGVKDLENIFSFFEKEIFLSVVFASPSTEDIKFSSDYIKYLKTFTLKPLTLEQAKKIIQKRLNKKNLIPSSLIKDILSIDKRPRQFLMNCEDILRIALSEGRQKIEKNDISTFKNKKTLINPLS
jgi:replication-associated recombination protein RarA